MAERLDAALASRGLARSRTHAATLIAEGRVRVNGRAVVKPSTRVDDTASVEVATDDHYVSRAAHKLVAALDSFDIRVEGAVALDMGASTGGFTQVLRERGADPVIAVDVGHGQIAASVALDPRVVVLEGFNVRAMTPANLRRASGVATAPTLVTADLSFISLRQVLPAARATAAGDADFVLLIKPQFEVGRTGVREGLVTDAAARADAVMSVLWAAWDVGLGTRGFLPSPLAGARGNREYLVHLTARPGGNPSEWVSSVDRGTGVA